MFIFSRLISRSESTHQIGIYDCLLSAARFVGIEILRLSRANNFLLQFLIASEVFLASYFIGAHLRSIYRNYAFMVRNIAIECLICCTCRVGKENYIVTDYRLVPIG